MKENLQDTRGPEWETQKIKQLPDLRTCGLKFGPTLGKAAQKREKQEWANEEPKLDNARRMRGIYFIDPDDGEFKETIKKRKEEVGNTDGGGFCLVS